MFSILQTPEVKMDLVNLAKYMAEELHNDKAARDFLLNYDEKIKI